MIGGFKVYQAIASDLLFGAIEFFHDLESVGSVDRGDFFKFDAYIWRNFSSICDEIVSNLDDIVALTMMNRCDLVVTVACCIWRAVQGGVSVSDLIRHRVEKMKKKEGE